DHLDRRPLMLRARWDAGALFDLAGDLEAEDLGEVDPDLVVLDDALPAEGRRLREPAAERGAERLPAFLRVVEVALEPAVEGVAHELRAADELDELFAEQGFID